ncbi:MAG: hypothetical protein WA210_16540, partial [Burkholderiaceae bacterium]
VQPAVPGATVVPINRTARQTPAPQQALPPAIQEKVTQGVAMLGFLDQAERGIKLTGGIEGIISQAKADPFWGNFIPGDAKAENALGSAFSQLKVYAQSVIKGTPSNFDVQSVIDTFPKFWASQGFNEAAIRSSKKVVAQMLVDTISFNQKDYKIPDNVREQIKALGVDPATLKVWNGGDALTNTYDAYLQGRPATELVDQAKAYGRGMYPLSTWQRDALRSELERRQKAAKSAPKAK